MAAAGAAAAAAGHAGRFAPERVSPARLILHTEASIGFGGQELRIVTESRWLLDHGWDVLIVGQPDSRLLDESRRHGVPAVAIRMRRVLDPRALLALRRLIASRHVALVHTHSSVDSWLGGLAAKSLRLPVVRSRHVTIPIRGTLVYRLADRVVASGDEAARRVRDAGIPADRVLAISAGVDLERFHPGVSGKRVRDELGHTGPLVGLVANLRGSKGHRYLLEAAPDVLRERPDTRFLIVGGGVGFDDIARRVREMGLEREVLMLGFRRDVPEILAALDVLTLPSIKSEATSQVLLQSLAVGTPVVATTVGGSPEVVRDGVTGRLVPPADGGALARAILDLLRDPERAQAMARAGQAEVRATQSMDSIMTRVDGLYRQLLGGR